MEYVEGKTLSQLIRKEGPLPAARVAEIADGIASALGFAHKGDVVHRDMKSGNVIISDTGQIKVADFGIATAISAGSDTDLTQTGAVMGTANYFSPEQAQGLTVDGRSDLYSLGVVMYEMLTGAPPLQVKLLFQLLINTYKNNLNLFLQKTRCTRSSSAYNSEIAQQKPR